MLSIGGNWSCIVKSGYQESQVEELVVKRLSISCIVTSMYISTYPVLHECSYASFLDLLYGAAMYTNVSQDIKFPTCP